MLPMDDRLRTNRINWNERTPVHAASDSYDVDGFKAGRLTLKELERREVGDVSGKTLLHLQCHFGLDTMSWERLGAVVTGVDFSDAAIRLAKSLRDETGSRARFILSDVYGLTDVLDERFDVVFTSYGVLCWLPDLDGWARTVARHLKPDGAFYIVEHHPMLGVFEQAPGGGLEMAYDYFHREIRFEGGEPSYAGDTPIESPVYEWSHSLGEIVTALISAGLRIEFLHEFAFCGYRAHPMMERGADGWWRFPERNESIPQMFSIRAALGADEVRPENRL